MRKWPSGPSMALLRAQFAHESTSSAGVALRNFHVSARRCEGSDSSSGKPSQPQPRPDRVDRSRSALSQLTSLSTNSANPNNRNASTRGQSQRPTGLRGGMFRGNAANNTSSESAANTNTSNKPISLPSGKLLIRRRTPTDAPSGPSRPRSPVRSGNANFNKNKNNGNRFGRPRRDSNNGGSGGNRNNNNRPQNRGRGRSDRPERRPREFEEDEAELLRDPSDLLPDGLVKHLLKENEKHHGDKVYQPREHGADELLAWTADQLPPLPSTAPATVLQKHLDATVTHRAEYAPTPTMDPVKQDARRLIAGQLVRFADERIKKGAVTLANAPKMQKTRKEEAERLGVDPAASVEFAELPEKIKKETEQRVVAGKYQLTEVKGKKLPEKTMDSVRKALEGNASYKPANIDRFLDAVEGLFEGKPRPRAPQLVRTGV